ncbi:hypothetical protein GCM10017786_52720 [Amycolatopsis deserti]|uniref:PE domain-containing protein n=1 Tax=Amycolatopsis deserti TaxID=185696 RepID=A0ABQ3J982_9PSEU|nr:PE domain-containing protein [Amycolatopsis deserti]GHF12223.1 hypothetical protein GCM10017786_52720 [Amycolatopsis deserti]
MAEDDLRGAGQGLAPTLGVPSVPHDLRVDPDKMLLVAQVISEQADVLDERIRQKLADLDISAPAQDVISTTAADAWNRLVARGDDSYAARVQAYVRNLRDLAAQLRQAAQAYQAGEEEKVAALSNRPKR